jgi:hypothetical protein
MAAAYCQPTCVGIGSVNSALLLSASLRFRKAPEVSSHATNAGV